MIDSEKSREQLLTELADLRERIVKFEAAEAKHRESRESRNTNDSKQTERELTKSKAMLQATIDCLPFDFFALDSDGRYILQNATCKIHWGDFIGKTPEEICPNEEDLTIWLDNNRRAFSGEKVEGDVSYSYQGDKRFFHNIITPIRSGEAMHGILGVNIDFTERKQAEEVLQKAHDELEQRVKERTAELIKTNEELAVFRKFVEVLVAGLRHGRPRKSHCLRQSDDVSV